MEDTYVRVTAHREGVNRISSSKVELTDPAAPHLVPLETCTRLDEELLAVNKAVNAPHLAALETSYTRLEEELLAVHKAVSALATAKSKTGAKAVEDEVKAHMPSIKAAFANGLKVAKKEADEIAYLRLQLEQSEEEGSALAMENKRLSVALANAQDEDVAMQRSQALINELVPQLEVLIAENTELLTECNNLEQGSEESICKRNAAIEKMKHDLEIRESEVCRLQGEVKALISKVPKGQAATQLGEKMEELNALKLKLDATKLDLEKSKASQKGLRTSITEANALLKKSKDEGLAAARKVSASEKQVETLEFQVAKAKGK
eukprot:gene30438-35448_t